MCKTPHEKQPVYLNLNAYPITLRSKESVYQSLWSRSMQVQEHKFHSCTSSLWNYLPVSATSVATFGKCLEVHLFDLVLPSWTPSSLMTHWCYGTASSILLLNTDSAVLPLILATPGIFIINHQNLSPLSGYWPQTSNFHFSLFRAICASWPQLCPIFFTSLFMQCFHVSCSLALLLVPWQFLCKACLAISFSGFQTVCPIQHHLCSPISFSIGLCFVSSHRFSFLTFSCHLIFRIFWRHLLMNVCTFLSALSIHSLPCFTPLQ